MYSFIVYISMILPIYLNVYNDISWRDDLAIANWLGNTENIFGAAEILKAT